MLLERKELLKNAYNELEEEIGQRIENLEEEINTLGMLKLKRTILDDTLYFLGMSFDSRGIDVQITVPEDVDEQIQNHKKKVYQYERLLEKLKEMSARYKE